MLGLTLDDYPDEVVEIWPENAEAVALFRRVCNQWIMGPGGPVALNLSVPIAMLDRIELSYDELAQRLDDLQVMAGVALEIIREQSDQSRKTQNGK